MATNADARYMSDPTKVRERVEAIYANRGADLNVRDAMRLTGEVYRGSYSFDDIRTSLESGQYIGTPPPSAGEVDRMPEQHMRGGGAPRPPEAKTLDFFGMAKALFPWLPDDLLRAYAGGWEETGDTTVALGYMRRHQSYDVFFKGNRREDGTFRYSETEYIAVKDGYRQNLAARGISPKIFEGKEHQWIEGDVSVQEHEERIRGYDEYLRRWGPQGTNGYSTAMNWYAQAHGVEMTEEAVLVSLMDPEVGQEIVKGRIPLAQIGGAAASFGYSRSLADARRLQGWGLTGDQALDVYGQASQRLPGMDAMARRAYDPEGGVGVGDFEEAFVGRDAQGQLRLGRNLQAERSSFSRRGTTEEDQAGRLSGLRQR